jgi:IclR family KDG regulon transcriptional repressor
MNKNSTFTIQSVKRATEILSLFSIERPRLGITEISQLLSLNKATVQGLIRTLAQQGFLQQDKESRKYELGVKLYELGIAFSGGLEINQKAQEPAGRLAREVEQLVRVAIQNGDTAVVILDVLPRTEPLPFYSYGPRIPLFCTALGKALLAFSEEDEIVSYLDRVKFTRYTPRTITEKEQLLRDLQETRNRGYSINQGEHLLARASVGAPIFGRAGRVMASISIGGDPRNFTQDEIEKLANAVMMTASMISRRMGFYPGSPVGE